MATAPALLARGTLAQTSLPEFLLHALDQELEGTLVLQGADGEKSAIYFAHGSPAKARLANEQTFLAQVIVDLGLVDRATSDRTRTKAEQFKKPHGEILVEEHLLDETTLYLALREQLHRQVLLLCKSPVETQFGVYGANLIAKWGGSGEWRVKPLPLVWRALMEALPDQRVAEVVSQLGSQPLRMRFEAPVSRYRMAADESSLIDLIRAKAQPLSSLEASGVGRPGLVARFAAALVLSRQLEGLADDRDPVGLGEPPESPASLPPPSQGKRGGTDARRTLSPASGMPRVDAPPRSHTPSGRVAVDAEHAEFRKEIEKFRDQDPVTLYDLLGVPNDVDATALRAAFFRLARRWHPDRLPVELEDLKPFVSKTFARMSEAHQLLSDPVKRSEYDQKSQQAPDSEQEKVIEILEAASSYQRAEILMKKRDFVGALAQAKLAYDLDGSQADHLALYAWLEASQRTSGYEEWLKMLDRAVDLESANVRVLWYRAQLLKKMGKVMPAVRDFRSILEIKPNHVDAQRELRVFEMRRRTDNRTGGGENPRTSTSPRAKAERGTTAPKPSLFGRLLKKD